MNIRRWLVVSLFSLALAACGGGGDDDDGGGGGGGGADAGGGGGGGGADAGGGGEFETLITNDWEVASGVADFYRCTRMTVTEDMYIAGFQAMAPLGTHHTVLSVHDNAGPDGEFDCSAGTGTTGSGLQMLYASGVGSDEFLFPDGVAVKIPAGKQITLNLHLFNVSDQNLDGKSGTRILPVDLGDVDEFAEFVFAGTFDISIPSNGQPHKESGSCTFGQDATVLTVWPHMHQLGTHMKVDHEGTMIHDKPYTFEEQVYYPVQLDVKQGEQINVECTYVNDTGSTVTFGDGSEEEMCFAGLYRYPAMNQGPFCVQFF